MPLGNAGGDSGSSFSISSTPSVSSSSFAMPSIGGESSDWSSQALQPSSAMAQSANLLESSSSDWTPKSAPQTTPVNYLETDSAPKPIASPNPLPSNSLLSSNNLLETTTQEKINPIVSKLARENSSNAPLLSQSLIGAPEAPKPLTTPNPLDKPDDWPKMPKVDWNAATSQDHGLLGPQKPMTPEQASAILSMKTYPQWREDNLPAIQSRYQGILSKAETAKTQQAQPPVQAGNLLQPENPGKRGVISTNPENPVYPDRGNFADKLWGPRVTEKPFVDEPRKGTYYFGGAGMDGAYIGDMVKSMQENGIGNAQAVDRSKWSIHEYVDAPMTLMRRNRDGAGTDFSQFGTDGKQFNMVGYSHGGLQAAQAAADYADAGGKVDHLVLVGTPISQEFLDKLKSNPNIGQVIVTDIQGQGDPIHAGMGAGEQLMSLSKLVEDRTVGKEQGRSLGHFYYTGADAIGNLRRRELAKQLYDWGLR